VEPTGSPFPRVILVVDDEPGLRRVVCVALGREGYTTIEAEDGQQALQLLEAGGGAIALVLCDIRMPGLDGIEIERLVWERWPGLPVVLMSGEVTRDWVMRRVRDRTINLLRKPFRPDDLVEVVRAALEGDIGSVGRGLA
jgi:two-component system response regulator AtoC